MKDYLNVIRNNYANFTGRARRREYWMFSLVNFIIILILEIPLLISLPSMSAAMDSSGQTTPPMMPLVLGSGLLIMVYGLAIIVPSLAVTARRLHDTGKSGWWYLLSFVPGIGGLVLLVFCVLDSEPGSNKWGPNPKGMDQASTVTANNW